jgi:hypothetical protein
VGGWLPPSNCLKTVNPDSDTIEAYLHLLRVRTKAGGAVRCHHRDRIEAEDTKREGDGFEEQEVWSLEALLCQSGPKAEAPCASHKQTVLFYHCWVWSEAPHLTLKKPSHLAFQLRCLGEEPGVVCADGTAKEAGVGCCVFVHTLPAPTWHCCQGWS